jgi:hypothetical protein
MMKLTITIDDPSLAEDLRVLAEATKETTDHFVARILKIAIDAAAERGRRQIAKEAKATKRG